MSDLLDQLLADLAAEGERLDDLVAGLDDSDDGGWRTPTPAEGWDVATQVAHLAWTDEAAVLAATDREGWDALVLDASGDPDRYIDRRALEGGRVEPAELLDRWRTARGSVADALRSHPDGRRMPWFGPPMSAASMATARFMETWAHSLDVHHALDADPEVTDRIRHVAHLGVRTRDFAFSVHGLDAPAEEFRVELTAPSGDLWSWGPESASQSVRGSGLDFCRLVTQRVHRDDTDLVARGRDATAWLGIAQAFAGPPGEGRAPTDG
ncbi:TIGR03084 family metal-binding protein [Nocardioides sp. GXQ0305]|uniref:TIGR03084 family metal-binding protein n=1 Tax=Nocardioides sp. GXQ0305 TaxID=3423912 RepID=UPI003D7D3638